VIPQHLATEVAEQGFEQEHSKGQNEDPRGRTAVGNYLPGGELKAECKAALTAAENDAIDVPHHTKGLAR